MSDDDLTDMSVCGLRVLKARAQEQLEAIDSLNPVSVFGFALGEQDPIFRLDYWKGILQDVNAELKGRDLEN